MSASINLHRCLTQAGLKQGDLHAVWRLHADYDMVVCSNGICIREAGMQAKCSIDLHSLLCFKSRPTSLSLTAVQSVDTAAGPCI